MHITINGTPRTFDPPPPPHETLLTTVRDRCFLTGAKPACEQGECGACTVLLDGRAVYACLTLSHACEGHEVMTIEGLASPDAGALHPVQDAFVRHDAVQCGFCTPGQVLSAVALLAHDPDPDDEAIGAAMSGNLCRCGTYPKIVRAIRDAARAMRGATAGSSGATPAGPA